LNQDRARRAGSLSYDADADRPPTIESDDDGTLFNAAINSGSQEEWGSDK
jgi:hypothetical protein